MLCCCTADYVVVDSQDEVEFLNALVVPLDASSGVTFVKGVDGFPAFAFASSADVQRPASDLLYHVGPDFSIVASILPFTAAGGSVRLSVCRLLSAVVLFDVIISNRQISLVCLMIGVAC